MIDDSKKIIMDYALAGAALRENFLTTHAGAVAAMAKVIAASLAQDGKILFCGNGGSAADSQHLAAEFVNRFLMDRPPLPGIALSTDTSALTAIGNDFGYDQTFEKQVRGLGRKGDALVGISTSGNAANVLRAVEAARSMGILTVGITGGKGGKLAGQVDRLLCVASSASTPRIQEGHQVIIHALCERIEEILG